MTATQKEFAKALKEIGEISPWWSEEDGLFLFEHASYPMVMHADKTEKDTVEGYMRALSGFIEARLAGEVASSVEKITSGRGGARLGAGRPAGTKRGTKKPSGVVRVPEEMAIWLRNKKNQEAVLKLMKNA